MTNTANNYINYFRQLAVSHKSLQHDPLQEGPAATQKGKCRFVLFDNDEVVIGLRSLVPESMVLYLEMFTGRGSDNLAGDYRANYQGRFLLARKTKAQDVVDMANAYDEAELVMWHIIARMLADSHYGGADDGTMPFRKLSLNDFSWEPVTNLWDGRTGWVVDFNYQQTRIDEIAEAENIDTETWTNG